MLMLMLMLVMMLMMVVMMMIILLLIMSIMTKMSVIILEYCLPLGECGADVPGAGAGLHRLVESLYGLQGEKSQLRGELRLLHSQLEQREQDRHSRVQVFQHQVQSITHAYACTNVNTHAHRERERERERE